MTHSRPTFQSAATTADGTKVILTYGGMGSDQLNSTTARPSAFNVRVNGTTVPVSSVSASGTTVELTLETPIETGDIVLFPSSVFHRTLPFDSQENRVTLAFDVKPMC